MKSVDQHLADVLTGVTALAPFDVQLLDARGALLAEDVTAGADVPPFDNSAMDGYAVRRADVAAASAQEPVVLPVVADIAAGSGGERSLAAGSAARIMTGAPLPAGADAVVPVEWTDAGVAEVRVRRVPEQGAFIRHRGDDVHAGEVVLRRGTRLGPRQIGLLAAIGRARVLVRPRPRVVVVSTGSELVEPGTPLRPGQIADANGYTLTAAAEEVGAVAYRVGAVPDDSQALLDTLEDQLVRADVLVTSGGVSVGAYDVVKEVLSRLGTVRFDRVAMQPGMPQGFGHIGPDETPIFTLPGNPVSAYVSFEVFVRPVLRALMGAERLHRPTVQAVCVQGFTSPAGKRQFARGRFADSADGERTVEPVGGAGSHLLGDLALANCLIVVPEDVTDVAAGSTVEVMVLERREA